jgi:hypothetical protein
MGEATSSPQPLVRLASEEGPHAHAAYLTFIGENFLLSFTASCSTGLQSPEDNLYHRKNTVRILSLLTTMLCDAVAHPTSTTPATAVAGNVNTDTALTILFGTIGVLLATMQVILSWQGIRLLMRRDTPN